jgi:hypothetical protein
MTDARKLRLIATLHCKQYNTLAKLYIQDRHPSGQRHLVAQYEKGGYQSRPEFATAIPDDWTEQEVMDLLLWPMKPEAPYPAWEVPARLYASEELFRWRLGEKPPHER